MFDRQRRIAGDIEARQLATEIGVGEPVFITIGEQIQNAGVLSDIEVEVVVNSAKL